MGNDNKPAVNVEMGTVTKGVIGPTDLVIGQWYHLVAQREGVLLKLYVNGVVVASQNIGSGAINNVSGRKMLIGKYMTPNLEANVAYDDLYIYSRALTAQEIASLYLSKAGSTTNRYLYNAGSELNDQTGSYEMYFRGYDPVLGRMSGVDVMAESYASLSPYQYGNNDPVYFNDPTGAYPWTSEDQRNHERGLAVADQAFARADAAFNSMNNPYWTHGIVGDDDLVNPFAAGSALIQPLETVAETYQTYGETHGESFTGSIYDLAVYEGNVLSFGVFSFLNGSAVGTTTYARSNHGWYRNTYPIKNGEITGVNSYFHSFNPTAHAPSGLDTNIPVWGSAKQAAYWFKNDDISRGALYSALALSDLFAIKAAVTSLGKMALKQTAQGAAKASTTVFRAVDVAEAASIKSTGKFLLNPGGTEVKYFAKSLQDAHWYGAKLYPNGYSIIQGTVKGPVNAGQYWFPHVDIGAYAFPNEILPHIIPH